jgi:hypothetical protein
LDAAGTTEIVFFLGEAARPNAQTLIAKYRKADLDAMFNQVVQQWDDRSGPCRSRRQTGPWIFF